jgi:Holliday junction resolvase RusA-like endonuclease
MHIINIKPLSVNQAWCGKRFKTNLYKQYEHDVLLLLPKIKIVEPPYRLNLIVGFSNKASDIDNILKPFLDILQKKYGINDKHIEVLHIEKQIVTKNNDFISFEIVEIKK